jgi:putative oxidoreductase
MTLLQKLADTKAPPAVVLIRTVVGGIFVSEGIQKFLFSDLLGAGRFEKIGIPAPAFLGPFVGVCELICGALLLAGLLTRLASIVLLISMSVAIVSTKLPVLLGHSVLGFSLPKLQQYGFWSALHEARADLLMIFGLVFLLVVGAGPWSGDARLLGKSGR